MVEIHYLTPDANKTESQFESIKSQIDSLSAEDIPIQLTQLEKKWNVDCQGDPLIPMTIGFRQILKDHERNSHGFPTEVDIESVHERCKHSQDFLSTLLHRSRYLEIYDNETVDITEMECKIAFRIRRIMSLLNDGYENIKRYLTTFDRLNHPTHIREADTDILEFSGIDYSAEVSQYQSLLLALLDETYKYNIKKYKGHCCRQIVTAKGQATKAWKQTMPISEFVYSVAQKETRFEVWKNLTARATSARDAIKHLTDCKDIQFPEIKKNRHVWSFNNGIFIGKEWDGNKYTCNFYTYESNEYLCLDPTIVSCKYFDTDFNNYPEIDDWWDIPTPYFQSIMEYQEFSKEVAQWMYVMGGKMCFDVGDIDRWQIIPFLKGIARSGKSTIITKVFKKFYENDDVRTLSNNIERKFGLSSIIDGFMFIAPEVKGDLCLEQAEFQSLVSGEDVSVACKYEKAKSVEWKTPGILGGNEVPNWKDNSGSVLRRLLPWSFNKQVHNADPHMDDKLEKELPAILMKCVKAYLEFAQKYADKDIWNVVPAYFKNIQIQVAMVTNSLQNFLASEKIKYGPELFCPQKIFVQIFNQHCQENNLGRGKFNSDFYVGPFSSRNIKVVTEAKTYKGRAYPAQPFVIGLDVMDDNLNFSDDY
jgi:hypothetical protein